ncbi:potassium-transporting ATPase subunit KdpC [Budvicia aquatica]|uniref:Potassium-transporting ATPase KdpC subunit n=1 Tax=Budvicia aquatica TaxID=82979 RepID=A0A2C6DUH7_9GAMM|nr:potassium-transporting ATPase subunit KdpC [Budvicia aquatica]PHI32491.1 potassium-transporting ATPase subunit KdpC [Budvicia aquatica]VFS45509.1 potassium-transporting ATPase subunit C [Budvicia aquatica]
MSYLRPAFVLLILLTLATGIIYPLAVTGLAQLVFPAQSQGSLVTDHNHIIGSSLIGQNFTRADYFHGRPSATAETPYNALASGGSNLAGSNPLLKQRIQQDILQIQQHNPAQSGLIPVDLVTASGSGLDPQISPEGAYYQAQRIAVTRQIPLDRVKQLIKLNTSEPLAVFGQPVVNVLQLNLALDIETQARQ